MTLCNYYILVYNNSVLCNLLPTQCYAILCHVRFCTKCYFSICDYQVSYAYPLASILRKVLSPKDSMTSQITCDSHYVLVLPSARTLLLQKEQSYHGFHFHSFFVLHLQFLQTIFHSLDCVRYNVNRRCILYGEYVPHVAYLAWCALCPKQSTLHDKTHMRG